MIILDVLQGPIHSSNVPDWDDHEDGWEFEFGQAWLLVVKARFDDGSVGVEELVFADRDDAMELVDHFVNQVSYYPWDEE